MLRFVPATVMVSNPVSFESIAQVPERIEYVRRMVGRAICPTGKSTSIFAMWLSSPVSKNIPLREQVETAIDQRGLILKRGAARDRHERGGWDAVDAIGALDETY
jgi:hypothetical protein